ncbi:ribose transport system ATP-binding protein [Aequitasia blattaphilus]|uniref:Sugar ABC transporter ATP-binding protein n=1 Tax=Aequitasia blattaphilus TaxID=2949332 RepID=A0ABT1EDI9_9FIRM|nr:sugar ABC transporter ATP-binding protein [Aequitasia blattaphilus]MCP1103022.1 sugar ABC transporter ATP-binding protein [Aequitasia blattaphilus]MCR8615662.1 sugar ABC transporter ATP-binding protein [Aequitasia blattaphilus]
MEKTKPILELKEIKKVYPGVTALNGVSIDFYPGEAHAICGENGAGKSTFIKCITGAIKPTEGRIVFKGEEVTDNSPLKSMDLGISAIYQEFNLIPFLSVAENIFYGNYPTRKGLVDFDKMEKESERILEYLGVDISVKTLVKDLSIGYQQIVEIAKSLVKDVKVLIMDEPSAPLTNNELKYLFEIVKKLKSDGVSIIYISHRLEEVFMLCEKISVLRDGNYVKSMDVADTTEEELIRTMVDRDLGEQYPEVPYKKSDKVLEVKNLTNKYVKDVSFSAYKGEILGFAGLVGAGRTEVMRAIFGADPIKTGEIILENQKIVNRTPKDGIQNGIGLLTEDRKTQGAILGMTIRENITYANLEGFSKGKFFVDQKKEMNDVTEYQKTLNIKTPSVEQKVKNLSGGNQQKVVLAKWLATNCKVLIFDEPTRGIDVGAKQEIYAIMKELVDAGKVVIMISSEMPELMCMSHRIIVMHEGRISGEILKSEATQEKILEMASH